MLLPCWASNGVWWANHPPSSFPLLAHHRMEGIFFHLLINHPPYLRLQLRHCTCHLSFKSASPICIRSSFHSSLFIKMRLNLASPCFSSLSLAAPLYSRACLELLCTCYDKHTANTFDKHLFSYFPSPTLSFFLPGFGELYLLADLFADSSPLIEACLGLLPSASSRCLSRREVERTFSFEIFLPASNSYLSSLNPHPRTKTAQLSPSFDKGSREKSSICAESV